MTIPARCNRRDCQARRNLSKRPEQYVSHPRCHIVGCTGLMYVDEYRLKKGAKDNAPVCRDITCDYMRVSGNIIPFHRISSKGCSGYNDYVTVRNNAPRSKHSPIPADQWINF